MIKFENNMLVLDSTATKDDVNAINEYADSIRKATIDEMVNRLNYNVSICQNPEDWCEVCHGIEVSVQVIAK